VGLTADHRIVPDQHADEGQRRHCLAQAAALLNESLVLILSIYPRDAEKLSRKPAKKSYLASA